MFIFMICLLMNNKDLFDYTQLLLRLVRVQTHIHPRYSYTKDRCTIFGHTKLMWSLVRVQIRIHPQYSYIPNTVQMYELRLHSVAIKPLHRSNSSLSTHRIFVQISSKFQPDWGLDHALAAIIYSTTIQTYQNVQKNANKTSKFSG